MRFATSATLWTCSLCLNCPLPWPSSKALPLGSLPQFLHVNRVPGILQGTPDMPSEAPAARCPGPASGGASSALEP